MPMSMANAAMRTCVRFREYVTDCRQLRVTRFIHCGGRPLKRVWCLCGSVCTCNSCEHCARCWCFRAVECHGTGHNETARDSMSTLQSIVDVVEGPQAKARVDNFGLRGGVYNNQLAIMTTSACNAFDAYRRTVFLWH
eukprot:Opistho-2@31486